MRSPISTLHRLAALLGHHIRPSCGSVLRQPHLPTTSTYHVHGASLATRLCRPLCTAVPPPSSANITPPSTNDIIQPSDDVTPLARQLAARVRATGAMTVAEFMNEVLIHPLQGYYTRQRHVGQHGDFVTAPEVAGMYGEVRHGRGERRGSRRASGAGLYSEHLTRTDECVSRVAELSGAIGALV